ncbi:MAG: hypothetical protein B6D55_01095 [Candidatus Omnitrophica bacterium 4484_70.2]|nr:MAG: hypothetical protein B6D55_01095 [Candidatus Omnitrophica bacterium 4484_70.2]
MNQNTIFDLVKKTNRGLKRYFKRFFEKIDLLGENSDKSNKYEIYSVIGICAIFLLLLYKLIITHSRMFAHDTIWYYGLIHYFYNSLTKGVFPYWDPYDYCGQPFYYNLGISRIFELPSLILIFINKVINVSLLTLYHWDFILRIIIIAIGIYGSFRQTNKYVASNLVVFISFLFSSFSFASMWQCGLLTTFMWTPYCLWFLLRLYKKLNLYNVVGFALFTGLSITSYQAGYVLTFLAIFILTFLINKRNWLFHIFRSKKNIGLLTIGMIIVILLSLQGVAVFIEKDRTIPLLRRLYAPTEVTYRGEGSIGKHNCLLDFIGLFFPLIAASRGEAIHNKSFSEGPLYIGIIPLLLAVMGICSSKDKWKINFLITFLVVSFLAVGGKYKLGPLGEWLFPFLRYAQNMQLFQPFIILTLMYFVGQGMDILIKWCRNEY